MMATVAFPARCAVAVICGEHLVSQVYPAAVPVEVFIDNAVELLNEDLRRRGSATLDPGRAYELHRANGTRLDARKTLDELGIEDGAALIIAPAEDGESFEPHFESLSTGLARVGKQLFAPVTAESAVRTALVIVGTIGLVIAGLTAHARLHNDSWMTAIPAMSVGVAAAVGSLLARSFSGGRSELADGLSWLSVLPVAIGLAAAAPGAVGAAHVFIAALAIAALTGALLVITRRCETIAAAVVTLCTVGGLTAATRMWLPVPAQRLGMGVLITLLVLITIGPTIALWAARIRPPHFGSITGRDLFRRGDGMPVDAVMPVADEADEDPGLDTTPRGAAIAEAAKRANRVLTGICAGAAICLPVAVWATLMPGQPRGGAAALLAALFVVIFISRARAFADRRQAIALVCGAVAAVCSAVVRYVLDSPADSVAPLLWGSLLLAAFGGAGLGAALLVPATRFTPLVRMAAEWVELAAVVTALPLAAWVGGVFSWVRMR